MFSKLREAHFAPSTLTRPVLDLCHCASKGESSTLSSSGRNADLGNCLPEELTPSQEEALCSLRKCLQESGVLLDVSRDADLVRFLRARSFDVPKAKVMYEAMLEWRKEVGAETILKTLHFPERKAIKVLYPHFHHKTDRLGRPVYIERLGQLQLDEILKVTTMDRMLLYHVKEWEVLINWKFPACSTKAGRTISQSLTILDLKGVTMKTMNKQVRLFIQKITKIDQDNYPEYLGKMFIVNAPTTFKAVWAMIKPWLDKRTQKKIEVCGSNFTARLLELIEIENLPEFLGGSCQCLEGCENSDAGPWKDVPFPHYYDVPSKPEN